MIGNVPQRAQEPLCDAGEYVVECHSYKGKTYPHSGPQRVHERVVRCRDCRHYTPESMTREDRGVGVYENVWEPGGCFNPSRCSTTWDAVFEQFVPVGIDTEPDGFCAWGERRAQ